MVQISYFQDEGVFKSTRFEAGTLLPAAPTKGTLSLQVNTLPNGVFPVYRLASGAVTTDLSTALAELPEMTE